MKNSLYWVVIGGLLLIIGLFVWYAFTPGKLDAFAQCLDEKGARFYGAFWCRHCQEQKQLFGKSAKKLPYIECSTPDGQGQRDECKDADIKTYPTWIFEDGSVVSGVQSLLQLSDKTSCGLPE